MEYAIVKDGVVVNAIISDSEFAESIGAIEMPAGFGIGDIYDGEFFHLEPSPKERREREYESNPLIGWEGRVITVDQANIIYLRYLAEGSENTHDIQALIVAAKESIRQMYPDGEGGL